MRKGLRNSLLFALLALLLLAIPVLSACSEDAETTDTTAAPAEVFNLKCATGSPEMDNDTTREFKEWAAEIATLSNGRLNIEIFWGGALGESKDALTMLDTGVADIIMEGYGFFADKFPLSDGITLPYLVTSSVACGTLMRGMQADGLLPEYDSLHLLYLMPRDPIMMFFRDKEVTSLEDLKGLKIRTNTQGWSTFVEALGGVPTSVATPDLYTSLETGVIDGIVTSLGFFQPMGMAEVCKYALIEPMGASMNFTAMSNAAWDRLPGDLQQIMTQVSEKYFWKNLYHQCDWYLNTYLPPVEQAGVKLVYLSEEEHARWVDATSFMVDEWITKVDATGQAGTELVKRAHVLSELLN